MVDNHSPSPRSPSLSRREVLLAGSGSLLSLTAGCGDQQTEATSDTPSKEGLPTPSVSTLDGTWELTDSGTVSRTIKRHVKLGTVSGTTQIYNHVPAQQRVSDKTRGEFSQPVGFAFASKLRLDGKPLEYVPFWVLLDNMKDEFIDRLQNREISGIVERDVLDKSFSPKQGGKVASQGFGGVYSVGPFTIPVELQNGETRNFRFDQYQLSLESFLVVWKGDDGIVYTAGGGWPAEPYGEETNWVSVTGAGAGDGVDIRVRVRLPLSRSEIKSDVIEIAESVK